MLFVLALLAAFLWLPSPLDWILVGLAVAVEVSETLLWYRWSRRRKARMGPETMIGRSATVVDPCRPQGLVRLDGELWQARSLGGADEGTEVEVVGRDGLTLLVEPAPAYDRRP